MKKVIELLFILVLSLLLVSCGKDDSYMSESIFNEYKEAIEENGYELNKLGDASTNITGWFEITDDDIVSLYRVVGDRGVLYIFLFPNLKSANKWYDKILVHTADTDYNVYIDGHYIITTNDDELNDIVKNVNE